MLLCWLKQATIPKLKIYHGCINFNAAKNESTAVNKLLFDIDFKQYPNASIEISKSNGFCNCRSLDLCLLINEQCGF